MKTFNINLENKHPVLIVALVVLLSIGIIAFMAGILHIGGMCYNMYLT